MNDENKQLDKNEELQEFLKTITYRECQIIKAVREMPNSVLTNLRHQYIFMKNWYAHRDELFRLAEKEMIKRNKKE